MNEDEMNEFKRNIMIWYEEEKGQFKKIIQNETG